MTNSDLTLVAALLDRTGSMMSCKTATEDGFNEFINGQKTQPGDAIVTLAQFDKCGQEPVVQFVYRNTPIGEVPALVLEPRGGTPLLDAIGEFVTQIGADLAALEEAARPGLVICVIMTDGNENASEEWSWKQINELITRQREQWSWQFVFLGANIDAVAVGTRMGVPRRSSMTYNAHDGEAVMDSYSAVGASVANMRSASMAGAPVAAVFSEEDRKRAMGKKTRST